MNRRVKAAYIRVSILSFLQVDTVLMKKTGMPLSCNNNTDMAVYKIWIHDRVRVGRENLYAWDISVFFSASALQLKDTFDIWLARKICKKISCYMHYLMKKQVKWRTLLNGLCLNNALALRNDGIDRNTNTSKYSTVPWVLLKTYWSLS